MSVKTKSPSYVKAFLDPDLVREWERFAKDCPYLFWVQAMNIKSTEDWKRFLKDKRPKLDHQPRLPKGPGEFVDLARARRNLYFQLARSFTEPTESLVRDLLSSTFYRDLEANLGVLLEDPRVGEGLAILREFLEIFKGAEPERLLEDLGSEHLTIFYDSYFPWLSCYESVYRSEKQTMGELTAMVSRSYGEAGFTPLATYGRDPPDDLKLELEFIYRLCEAELGAWRVGDKPKALEHLRLQKEHIHLHLVEWVPHLCDDLTKPEFKLGVGRKFHREGEAAERYKGIVEFDFYRAMGHILKPLLEHDYAQVEAMLAAAEHLSPGEVSARAAGVEPIPTAGERFYLEKVA